MLFFYYNHRAYIGKVIKSITKTKYMNIIKKIKKKGTDLEEKLKK